MSERPWTPASPSAPMSAERSAQAFARSLGGPDGDVVCTHLRRLFLDRRLPPTVRDAELWYLEGQRSVVAHLLMMIERGRGGQIGRAP